MRRKKNWLVIVLVFGLVIAGCSGIRLNGSWKSGNASLYLNNGEFSYFSPPGEPIDGIYIIKDKRIDFYRDRSSLSLSSPSHSISGTFEVKGNTLIIGGRTYTKQK